jgi:hypothetical protein
MIAIPGVSSNQGHRTVTLITVLNLLRQLFVTPLHTYVTYITENQSNEGGIELKSNKP